MGANAQTTVPKFVAANTLPASSLNITAGTGIPVFANTTTRDAAFGGSNKALAQGQTCYLESTNVVQYYNGSAWATVGPSTAGGLVFITGTTFSAQTAVSLPTNTFSATYANYRIIFNITSASADANDYIRFRTSGTDNTTSAYYSAAKSLSYGGTNVDTYASGDTLGYTFGHGTGIGATRVWDIINPQVSAYTLANFAGNIAFAGGGVFATGGVGFFATTSFDSMSFIPASGTITGSYKVYGYTNS